MEPRKVGASKGRAPQGGGPKNSRFFPLPPHFSFFLHSLEGLPAEPPGFHTTVREPKRGHLRAPVFKNTTKIPREDLQEREERIKNVAGEGKKSEILGGRVEGGSGRAFLGRAVLPTPLSSIFVMISK